MSCAVIVAAVRSPIGCFLGKLSSLSAVALGAHVIKSLVERSKVLKQDIDEVIMGQVLQGGTGQAPARQAMLLAGLLPKTSATTVNKVCGSGLKAIMMGADAIALDHASLVIAGGMESMSNAPYILAKARQGYRMGHETIYDLMLHDGLLDPYSGHHMGGFAERCGQKYHFSREEQDDYAKASYLLAKEAHDHFIHEIAPITISHKGLDTIVDSDEEVTRFQPEKMSHLKPAFAPKGNVTAANASKINDGAAALLLMSEGRASSYPHQFRIRAYECYAHEPSWFTTAPIMAITSVLKKAKLNIHDIDLFEINEAFSVVAMAAIKELNLSRDKVNVFGGAIALGHPIGCSGARLVVTLINALTQRDKRLGCVAICLGGGEALAMIIERIC